MESVCWKLAALWSKPRRSFLPFEQRKQKGRREEGWGHEWKMTKRVGRGKMEGGRGQAAKSEKVEARSTSDKTPVHRQFPKKSSFLRHADLWWCSWQFLTWKRSTSDWALMTVPNEKFPKRTLMNFNRKRKLETKEWDSYDISGRRCPIRKGEEKREETEREEGGGEDLEKVINHSGLRARPRG